MSFETLEQHYPSFFTDNWVTNFHHYTPAFIIFQGDTLHQNTIDDSNVQTIYEELVNEFPHEVHKKSRPYVEEVYVHVDDLESNEELAEKVLEILKALEDYPIYDESHYCDLEHARLVEYMQDYLVVDLAHALGMDEEAVAQWVLDNEDTVWDHFDGSVDDVPFNIEEIATLVS